MKKKRKKSKFDFWFEGEKPKLLENEAIMSDVWILRVWRCSGNYLIFAIMSSQKRLVFGLFSQFYKIQFFFRHIVVCLLKYVFNSFSKKIFTKISAKIFWPKIFEKKNVKKFFFSNTHKTVKNLEDLISVKMRVRRHK